MPQKRDFCSRCQCCSWFRVCKFPVLAEVDLSPCCPLLPALFILVVSPSIEENTSPTFSPKLVEFMKKLQNRKWVFLEANSVFPHVVLGPHRQGPCQPWDGLWDGRAGAQSPFVLPPAGVTSVPARMKCSRAGTQAAPPCGFGRKGFCFQCFFLEGISLTGIQDLFQRKETKPAGRKIKTHLLSL